MDGFGVQLTIIHRYSATLRWIIVLAYTKLVNSQRQKKKLKFIWSKLGWKADYSRLHFILQTSRYLVDISRTWVANQSALVWYILNQNKLACQGQLYPEQHGFLTNVREICVAVVHTSVHTIPSYFVGIQNCYFSQKNLSYLCQTKLSYFAIQTSIQLSSKSSLIFAHKYHFLASLFRSLLFLPHKSPSLDMRLAEILEAYVDINISWFYP